MTWEPYDPAWLVELAREQCPGEPALAEALARCTRARREGRAYLHFVEASGVGRPGAEWQVERNVMLESRREGAVVLDVLRDGRVGGVEFLARL